MTERPERSGDRPPPSDAHCRRLAGRALAAVAAHAGGFVVVAATPPSARRPLLQALRQAAAAARFQVVEIPRTAGADPGLLVDKGVTVVADGAPPLFVVVDTERSSPARLRELCEAAPLSAEWATMLSVRAVLITRFAAAELDFLQPRIIASLSFDEIAHDDARPAAGVAIRGSRVQPPPRAAAPPPRRDLRAYAMLSYVAAVGAVMGCYLALQATTGHRDARLPPGRSVSAATVQSAASRSAGAAPSPPSSRAAPPDNGDMQP